jgi:hypothetical protein
VEGSGVLVTDVRVLEHFSEVNYAGPGTLTLRQANTTTLTVSGDDNLVSMVSSQVTGKRLNVQISYHFAPHGFQAKLPLIVNLAVPQLTYLRGNARMDRLTGEEVTIEAHSTNEIVIDELSISRLKVIMTDASKVQLLGEVQHLEVTNWGSGNFDGSKLQSRSASVHVNSTGSASVRVSTSLEAVITSSGSLSFIGDPAVSQQVTGTGSVEKIADK